MLSSRAHIAYEAGMEGIRKATLLGPMIAVAGDKCLNGG